ncbi:hypothetical protein PILCRDRAFT_824404 [Piloderma croceum F 1598]|uniref:Uncharacterized protein n=1 Tax=Piloderma croceum (strain F 1598) TaxID=765440 RepID=A0A0C3FER9_PILCF|nr:hypothetical protein PILCRDRAFT_824404 [Piloderma croceum F 1598]
MTVIDLPTPPHSGCHAPTILFEAPYKASNPIEIPARRRHVLLPALSPINRPLSPELIFEMSPINSSATDSFFSSDYNTHYSPFVHRSYKNRTAESASTSRSPPFMYPFPRPPAHHHYTRQVRPDRLAASQSPDTFPSSTARFSCSMNMNQALPSSNDDSPLQPRCLTSAFEDDFENSSECQSQVCTSSASASSSRGRSRRRSSVYARASTLASPESIYGCPRGRAVVSRSQLSPQILPNGDGRKFCFEGLSSKDAEPTSEGGVNKFDVGFGKHLMMRTRDEKRVKVGRASVVSSERGSLGDQG